MFPTKLHNVSLRKTLEEILPWDFPDSPVIRTLASMAENADLNSGWELKSPMPPWHVQKKKKTEVFP